MQIAMLISKEQLKLPVIYPKQEPVLLEYQTSIKQLLQ
jgi:hypothetical protein